MQPVGSTDGTITRRPAPKPQISTPFRVLNPLAPSHADNLHRLSIDRQGGLPHHIKSARPPDSVLPKSVTQALRLPPQPARCPSAGCLTKKRPAAFANTLSLSNMGPIHSFLSQTEPRLLAARLTPPNRHKQRSRKNTSLPVAELFPYRNWLKASANNTVFPTTHDQFLREEGLTV